MTCVSQCLELARASFNERDFVDPMAQMRRECRSRPWCPSGSPREPESTDRGTRISVLATHLHHACRTSLGLSFHMWCFACRLSVRYRFVRICLSPSDHMALRGCGRHRMHRVSVSAVPQKSTDSPRRHSPSMKIFELSGIISKLMSAAWSSTSSISRSQHPFVPHFSDASFRRRVVTRLIPAAGAMHLGSHSFKIQARSLCDSVQRTCQLNYFCPALSSETVTTMY